MKKTLLFLAAVAVASTAMAQVSEGEYYIRNVKTGFFLNGGYSWGTKAIIKPQARAFQLVATDDADIFTIKSTVGLIKVENAEYYIDANDDAAARFYFAKTDDGAHYRIECNGKTLVIEGDMLTFGGGEESWESGQGAAHSYDFWPVTHSETFDDANEGMLWDLLTHAEMLETLAAASDANPIDASFLIKAHMMDINDSDNTTAWTVTKNGEPAEMICPPSGWDHSLNSWINNGTYGWFANDEATADVTDEVRQEVTGAPKGTYEVEYRVVNQSNTPLTISFNDTKAEATPFDSNNLWYNSAADYLKDKNNIKKAVFTVGDDGKLAISMKKESKAGQQNRFAFKSFILTYHGTNSSLSGLENIAVEAIDTTAPAEYYNLHGIRVANPTPGIYLIRQGTKVTKQLLR